MEGLEDFDRDFKEKLAIDFYGYGLAMKMFMGLREEVREERGVRERAVREFGRVKREIYLGRVFQALEMVPYLMSRGL